jgi:hypothetical protein
MGLVEGARVIRREVSASIRFVLVQSCYKCQKWRNANPDAPLLQSLLFFSASGRQMPICAAQTRYVLERLPQSGLAQCRIPEKVMQP